MSVIDFKTDLALDPEERHPEEAAQAKRIARVTPCNPRDLFEALVAHNATFAPVTDDEFHAVLDFRTAMGLDGDPGGVVAWIRWLRAVRG
jgi:hypothetical protein